MNDLDKIDDLLDEQIIKFPTGVDISKGKTGVPIKLINTDIEFITDYSGNNTGLLLVAMAEVDSIKYGAIYDARTYPPTGYVEELYTSPGNISIKSISLIKDPLEWSILCDFFNRNQVWEGKKIYNWIISYKDNTLNKNIDNLNKSFKNIKISKNTFLKMTKRNIKNKFQ